MKKVPLLLITLFAFELVGQSAPISKWRLAKEHALGWWDQLRGKYWLSRPANYERNVEPGFEKEGWWKQEIARRVAKNPYQAEMDKAEFKVKFSTWELAQLQQRKHEADYQERRNLDREIKEVRDRLAQERVALNKLYEKGREDRDFLKRLILTTYVCD